MTLKYNEGGNIPPIICFVNMTQGIIFFCSCFNTELTIDSQFVKKINKTTMLVGSKDRGWAAVNE